MKNEWSIFTERIFLIAFLLLFSSSFSQISGKWIATDFWGTKSDFTFTEDHFIKMTVNGEVIDGTNFSLKGGKNEGKIGYVKYVIDYTKQPITVDFIAQLNEDGKPIELGRFYAILKFNNDDEVLVLFNFTEIKEIDFNENNAEQIIKLNRVK